LAASFETTDASVSPECEITEYVVPSTVIVQISASSGVPANVICAWFCASVCVWTLPGTETVTAAVTGTVRSTRVIVSVVVLCTTA
jgi:hypothetical protein